MRRVSTLLAITLAAAAGPALAAGPAVTLYTRDLAFVRELRNLEMGAASDTVRLTDIPERIDFSSVALTPSDGGARVTRLAYRYDIASGDGLIDKARGARVRINTEHDRVVEGVLVAADGAWLVVRADDGSLSNVSRSSVETLRLASPPAGLSVRPALEAAISGGKRGPLPAELAYLTGGLSWSAEHHLVRSSETAGTWSTRVTVDNQSGRDYVDAAIKLVAGEPRRAGGMPPPMPRMAEMKVMNMAADGAAAEMTQDAFADYHLYTLGRPATLRDREQQSLGMLDPRKVTFAPRYLYRGGDHRGVTTQIVLMNDKSGGLNVPLPGGRVRIYETDPAGALQFTGETTIGHTAEGEKLTLEVGQAFDLVAERRDLYSKRISDREREYAVEIKLRNQKKSGVTIVIEESAGGDVEIIKPSHPFTRKDANTLQFEVAVAAGKETVVTYTARQRW